MRCVLGGVASALIGNVLLTGAAQQVYSSCDIAVTFIQSAPAAASPQEASTGPHGRLTGPQRWEWALFELADAPLSGNFCCLCRKASGSGSGGAAVILWAGWAFSTSPPFQETHFAVSSLCVCNGGKDLRQGAQGSEIEWQRSTVSFNVCIWKGQCSAPNNQFQKVCPIFIFPSTLLGFSFEKPLIKKCFI